MRVMMPSSVAEACAVMAEQPTPPTPIAGGTDVMAHWPVNPAAHDRVFLDLSGVGELRGVRWTDSHLELGALATYWDVIRDARCNAETPLLVAAARTVGAIQIQSRGTWAGNVVNASPAADGVPALMAMDASVVLVSKSAGGLAREEVRLDEFYLGYKKMRLRPGQLVEAIRVPRRTYALAMFEKVGARRAQAITKVGVAVTRCDTGWRVVANSVAPVVKRCPAVEALLESGTPIRSPLGFVAALAKDIAPIDDIRSTAAYRRAVLGRVLYFGLRGKAGVV